ncbi:zinc ribbon domain-containing protein [Massilia brevitalea]|uniref:zinc ribbon domain-containing protein n=1 Tax=Massilia brevitalea TaxID=442526 RepID=UPI00351CD01C
MHGEDSIVFPLPTSPTIAWFDARHASAQAPSSIQGNQMFCTSCGAQAASGSAFCSQCGKPLAAAQQLRDPVLLPADRRRQGTQYAAVRHLRAGRQLSPARRRDRARPAEDGRQFADRAARRRGHRGWPNHHAGQPERPGKITVSRRMMLSAARVRRGAGSARAHHCASPPPCVRTAPTTGRRA